MASTKKVRTSSQKFSKRSLSNKTKKQSKRQRTLGGVKSGAKYSRRQYTNGPVLAGGIMDMGKDFLLKHGNSIMEKGKQTLVEKGKSFLQQNKSTDVNKPTTEENIANSNTIDPSTAPIQKEQSMTRGIKTLTDTLRNKGIVKGIKELANNQQFVGDITKIKNKMEEKYGENKHIINSMGERISTRTINSEPIQSTSNTINQGIPALSTSCPDVDELRNILINLQKEYLILLDKVRTIENK